MPSLADITENDVITIDQVDRDILVNLQNDGRSSASNIAYCNRYVYPRCNR